MIAEPCNGLGRLVERGELLQLGDALGGTPDIPTNTRADPGGLDAQAGRWVGRPQREKKNTKPDPLTLHEQKAFAETFGR